MNHNTTQEIDIQISKVKILTTDNIKDISEDDAMVIYTKLIKVSNILLNYLMICQNKRENDNT